MRTGDTGATDIAFSELATVAGPAFQMMKACLIIGKEIITMVQNTKANKAKCRRLALRCFNVVEELKK
jgi:hypothetical protein